MPAGAVPEAKFGSNARFVALGESGVNYYFISDVPSGSNSMSPAFTPTEVLAVDLKMDDGLAASGEVKVTDRTNFFNALALTGGLTSSTDCVTSIGGDVYNVSDDVACSIRIRIGTTTGDLK